jgi:hypothetical protein
MTDLAALRSANTKRWANARLTRNFSFVAKHLVSPSAKSRYQAVAAKTGVPWAAIAVIHERECSQDWTGSLAQGDPWNRVSVHVPAGRGPFRSWEDAAVDALVNCAPYAARNEDWSIGGTLTKLEEYNGLVTPPAACRRHICGQGPINIDPANISATACTIRMPLIASSGVLDCCCRWSHLIRRFRLASRRSSVFRQPPIRPRRIFLSHSDRP